MASLTPYQPHKMPGRCACAYEGEEVSCLERCGKDDIRNLNTQFIHFIVFLMGYFVVRSCVYGILLPSMHPGRPQSEEFGWYLLGNTSLASPYAMEMSWLNHTAGSPEVWTPPPEWRDHCIRSYGVPISACSYFAAVEAPDEMATLWTAYFIVLSLVCLLRVFLCLLYTLRQLWYACRLVGWRCMSLMEFTPMVPMDLGNVEDFANKMHEAGVTPVMLSNVQKSTRVPGCHLASGDTVWPIWIALELFFFSFVISEMYALAGPGLGLVHSRGTGLAYFGAGWATTPLPAISELAPLHWSAPFVPKALLYPIHAQNWHWMTTFASEWGFMLNFEHVGFSVRLIFSLYIIVKLVHEKVTADKKVAVYLKKRWANIEKEETKLEQFAAGRSEDDPEVVAGRKALLMEREDYEKAAHPSNVSITAAMDKLYTREKYPMACSCREYCRWFVFTANGWRCRISTQCIPIGGVFFFLWPLFPIVTNDVYKWFITLEPDPTEEQLESWLLWTMTFLRMNCVLTAFWLVSLACFFWNREVTPLSLIQGTATVAPSTSASAAHKLRARMRRCNLKTLSGKCVLTSLILTTYCLWVLAAPNGMFLQLFGVENAFADDHAVWLFTGADAAPATAGANLLAGPKLKFAGLLLSCILEYIFMIPISPWFVGLPSKSYVKEFRGRKKPFFWGPNGPRF